MRYLLLLLVLAFVMPPSSMMAQAPTGEAEISHLLDYVEHSGAKFIRSGKEYSGREGAEHLRSKLQKAGGRVKTADDFIEGIASKSYLTGESYQVKLADGTTKPAGPWLREELARFRKKK